MLPLVTVFISSTWLDLQVERQAVATSLHRMRETKFVGMEYFGSRPETPTRASLDEVDRSQLYVGIFGRRYGSGITEQEYRRARERELPCFLYFMPEPTGPDEREESDPQDAAAVAALKRELRDSGGHIVSEFTSPDDLAAKITADLHRWLFDKYLAPQLEKVARRPLETAIFQALIQKKTRDFAGREFVFGAINQMLNDAGFPGGYISIVGEPGIGKTALLAQLVRQHGYVHHFNIATDGIRSPSQFLRNVCAQLIVRYQLGHDTLRDDADQSSAFLSQLLAEAAAALPAGDRLVIAIDALDEAEALDPRANCLYLPHVLPDHVYCIVTTRPKEAVDYRLYVERRRSIDIDKNDPNNLDDVRDYVRMFIASHRETMASRLAAWGASEEQFSGMLVQKSEGNFLYLFHVLRDIESGALTAVNIDDIGQLPQGLKDYYAYQWGLMSIRERFEEIYKPVVCQLATVLEPVSLGQLEEWTGLSRSVVKQVVNACREFLNKVTPTHAEPSYRVYHASFRDFLREEIGLKEYHSRISENAIQKFSRSPDIG